MSVTEVKAGEGINVIDPTTTPTISTNGTMTVTKLTPSYQSEMIDYINSADKLVFVGDSITYGVGNPPMPVPYRWPKLLSDYLGKEEINIAVPGDTWPDQTLVLYNKWKLEDKPSCPYFFACGINDLCLSTAVYNQDAILNNMLGALFYATLPSSCIKVARLDSPDIITTGICKNSTFSNNVGLYFQSNGIINTGSIETTVTGRYIVINMCSYYIDKNRWDIFVDGEKIDIVPQAKRAKNLKLTDEICWVYDTLDLTNGTHNVKMVATIEKYSSIFVDYIAGFSEAQVNTNPIFVAPIYRVANITKYLQAAAYPYIISYNLGLKQTCRMLRNVFKFPVYYMEDTTDTYIPYGSDTSILLAINEPADGLHPGKTGYYWIYERILNFLENGEYIYRNTM